MWREKNLNQRILKPKHKYFTNISGRVSAH